MINLNVIMRNVNTRDELKALLVCVETIGLVKYYTVKWFGTQEVISSHQGWFIKEECA